MPLWALGAAQHAIELWLPGKGRPESQLAEREGFEPGKDPLPDQQVTDSEENPVPIDPLKSP
jgi:hypothetical protein